MEWLGRIMRFGIIAAGASVAAAGCWGGESGRIDAYTCEDPCGNGQPGTSCDNPCGDCVGQCIPIPPLRFDGPMIVYFGAELDAPECPPQAPVEALKGYADLFDPSFVCPPCECSQPACVLPDGLMVSSETCMQGAGGTQTFLDAPDTWAGQCVSPGIASSNDLGSVTIPPLTVSPCAPIPPDVAHDWQLDPIWKTFARACRGQVDNGRCADPGMLCMPTAEPPPPGFRQCIAAELGTEPEVCPDTYKNRFVVYDGAMDTRGCTECTCQQVGQPDCAALVSVHQSTTCASLVAASMVDTSTPLCSDLGAMVAQVGGVEASWIVNDPGSCVAEGGEAFGEVVPEGPTVFCCQDPP